MAKTFHVGSFHTTPTESHECLEAIWSEGKECRTCPNTQCYRRGWTAKQVTADNKLMVLRKTGKIRGHDCVRCLSQIGMK